MADQLVARALDVRGISIHYWEAGAGRPLLLIHGVTPDHRQMVREWEPAFEGRSGWRRIYPDLPGRGETPGADWIASQDDMLHVTLEFLGAVAPGERFVVGGSSWGGYIALGIVHERAADLDGAAFVVSNPLREGRTLPEPRVLVRDEGVEGLLRDDERGWLERTVVQTPATLAAYREAIAPALAAADMAFIPARDVRDPRPSRPRRRHRPAHPFPGARA
ncbi:MAG: alpha/beta hydrolase [Chloroflexi bacterium]|nr:alpha/beta hydrolase [Chloroflexota bacterium]